MTVANGWRPGAPGDPEDKPVETLDDLREAAAEIGDVELEHDRYGSKKGERPCSAAIRLKNGSSDVTAHGKGESANQALHAAYFEAVRMSASPPFG